MSFCSPRTRAGFTLIELLVVIAIIAILAAILFPVFAQAREKARQAACLSNTKQMALGIMQYTNDFDELLPVVGDNAQNRGRWFVQIYPYVKNANVFTCPNVPDAFVDPTKFTTNNSLPRSGYGWSRPLGSDPATWNGTNSAQAAGFSLASIAKPAETIIIGDVGIDSGDVRTLTGYRMEARDPRLAANQMDTEPWYKPQFRHNNTKTLTRSIGLAASGLYALPAGTVTIRENIEGRCNFSFLDGHSKSLDTGGVFKKDPNNMEDGHQLKTTEDTQTTAAADNIYLLWNVY